MKVAVRLPLDARGTASYRAKPRRTVHMLLPAIQDTIVAVSTGWTASPLGVVRLSGPQSVALVTGIIQPRESSGQSRDPCAARGDFVNAANAADCAKSGGSRVGDALPARGFVEGMIRIGDAGVVPATIFVFRSPRSYTGQDVVEIHMPGCLPLLRLLCDELIRMGARRALPGEFTARAFMAGKIAAERVGDVAAAIHAETEAGARAAARGLAITFERRVAGVVESLNELLALVEAGIDFVDEEDVTFITPGAARAAFEATTASLRELRAAEVRDRPAAGFLVALAGLPNAGKSTLFNALVGRERAIVSPVVGTTRDVISAEIELLGQKIVLQDTAGLGASDDEISAAAHVAAETAARDADLVLWVHDGTQAWDEHESRLAASTGAERRMIVVTKADLRGEAAGNFEAEAAASDTNGVFLDSNAISNSGAALAAGFEQAAREEAVSVCAIRGLGMDRLRSEIVRRIQSAGAGHGRADATPAFEDAVACLERAALLVPGVDDARMPAELIAAELRLALAALDPVRRPPDPEAVLGRIFATFCIGK